MSSVNGLAGHLFRESKRFYHNAKGILKEASISNGLYEDHKPVRESAGTAWLALRFAVQGLAAQQGVSQKELPKDLFDCELYLAKHPVKNGKVQKAFKIAYQLLHVAAYYDGITDVELVKKGFTNTRFVIEKLSGSNV